MDRNKFSAMIDEIGLQQPAWKELTTTESALGFSSMGKAKTTTGHQKKEHNIHREIMM